MKRKMGVVTLPPFYVEAPRFDLSALGAVVSPTFALSATNFLVGFRCRGPGGVPTVAGVDRNRGPSRVPPVLCCDDGPGVADVGNDGGDVEVDE